MVAYVLLLVVGLGGLAIAAVSIAHSLLPRQFTAAQRRQIVDWEMERRWRTVPAGDIFPASVSYTVPANDLYAASGLVLQAQRLAISPAEGCAAAFESSAGRVLSRHGCSTVLRATYVDSSGSMVATVVVAVLPAGASASSVVSELGQPADGAPGPVHAFAVAGTPAAGFDDANRQVSSAVGVGPYVILSTAGFTSDRRQKVSSDQYVSEEMSSLAGGLLTSAQQVLGRQPRVPRCPGSPGC